MEIAGQRRGRMHSPSLHRLSAGDDRIFSRREEIKSKDTAVTLLIDNSGSMRGEKARTAMVAGYALASTLERVKIPNEVLGFTTGDFENCPETIKRGYQQQIWGGTGRAPGESVRWSRWLPIVMPVYKDFNERISSEVKKRIAFTANAQKGMASNIDGECLEYAAIRLAKRKEKRKVLIVLSDGQPAGAENADGHLKMTVEKLTKMGFELIGIGIKDGSVRHYYPKSVVLHNIADLPGSIMKELRTILK
jgi:cobalamin biosynthesis protein CobT